MKNIMIRLHVWYHGHVPSYIGGPLVVCSCGKQWVR